VAKAAPRSVAIYPEIKHPAVMNTLDILRQSSERFEDIVLDVLQKYTDVLYILAVLLCPDSDFGYCFGGFAFY